MNESGRVEAFSDGVFAIAITLLILDIKVNNASGGGALAPGRLGVPATTVGQWQTGRQRVSS